VALLNVVSIMGLGGIEWVIFDAEELRNPRVT
jgi:hypothetical protein